MNELERAERALAEIHSYASGDHLDVDKALAKPDAYISDFAEAVVRVRSTVDDYFKAKHRTE
jgi:hypothetical protein